MDYIIIRIKEDGRKKIMPWGVFTSFLKAENCLKNKLGPAYDSMKNQFQIMNRKEM